MATIFAYWICLLPIIPVIEDTVLEIDGKSVEVQISPDGRHALFTRSRGRTKHLFLADGEGNNVRQLTHGSHANHSPAWSSDSARVLFCSTRTGKNEVFSIGADGSSLKQITETEHGAIMPKYSVDGHLSYIRLHPRKGKSRPGDLVLKKNGQELTVVQNKDVSDYGWSHDGQKICFSTVNQINFFDLKTGKTISVNTLEQDDRLFSHGGYQITWSPDNDRVACRIRFLGGRTAGTKIFGDSELFLVGVDRSFETVSAKAIKNRTEVWIQKAFGNLR